MILTFLGTGAADWPQKKPEGAKEFRRLSSLLIDGVLLIDPGPCVPDALAELGIDPRSIRYILNTHPHADHLSEEVLDEFLHMGASFYPMAKGEEIQIGTYTVRAFAANHATASHPVHFIIKDAEGKRIFYGLDGAWLLYEEAMAIKEGVDLAVFDATVGDVKGDYRVFEHNNLLMVCEMCASLGKAVSRRVISHMARTLHTDHDTLVSRMAPEGIEVAYDGMTLKI